MPHAALAGPPLPLLREGAPELHAHLGGRAVLATYASKAWDFARLVGDEALYYPRCVRLPR